MVVGVTVLLVLLYKYRCMKIIYGYLVFSVFSLLFFTGGVLLGNLILRFEIVIDWPSFVFLLANFAALGSFAVFFTAPSIVKQGMLVCISVIMAWSLSKLPEWSNWTILIALAVYDLFAVLSPCGPLKALVEMSQSRNEPIPGLVYEADAPPSSPPPAAHSQPQGSVSEQEEGQGSGSDAGPRQRARAACSSDAGADGASIEMQSVVQAAAVDSRDVQDVAAAAGGDEEREAGVKLGLGDFVFYSVLVSRCVTEGTVTWRVFTCTSLVMQSRVYKHDGGRHDVWRHRVWPVLHSGAAECCEISYYMTPPSLAALAIYACSQFEKALPALPISIFLGIAVYFASVFALAPMLAACTQPPFQHRIFVTFIRFFS
jgi:presenilin 1